MKTNKQSIRKEAEASSINIYARILSSYTLGGGEGGFLIGSMDFRWTGSVGFESSVIPGGQGVFWQADLREGPPTAKKGDLE